MKKQTTTMQKIVQTICVVIAVVFYFLPIPFLAWSLSWLFNWLFLAGKRVGCIFVQAFGRNSFKDKDLVSILEPILAKSGGDVVKAFQMLRNLNFDPGKSNLALAKITFRLYRRFSNAPVIAQWEVVYAIWQIEPQICEAMIEANHMFTLWPRGEYYPTYEVKKDSIRVMKENGLSDPLELAQPDMAFRALLIIWRLGASPSLYLAWVPFDWASVQLWTKTFAFWGAKEPLVRAHHIKHGWVAFRPPREQE